MVVICNNTLEVGCVLITFMKLTHTQTPVRTHTLTCLHALAYTQHIVYYKTWTVVQYRLDHIHIAPLKNVAMESGYFLFESSLDRRLYCIAYPSFIAILWSFFDLDLLRPMKCGHESSWAGSSCFMTTVLKKTTFICVAPLAETKYC